MTTVRRGDRMRRREVIAGLTVTAAAWPLVAGAQPSEKVYRLGFIGDSPDGFRVADVAFSKGLRDLGYVEGRNLVIEFRWAEGKPQRIREFAEELARLGVDAIIVPSSIYTEAAKQ